VSRTARTWKKVQDIKAVQADRTSRQRGRAVDDPTSPASTVAPDVAHQAEPQAGRCKGRKKSGDPCRATATGTGWCPFHDPNRSNEEKAIWRRRGAAATHRRSYVALQHERAATAPTLPPGVDLPPVPVPGSPDWSTAVAIREYLQSLAGKVLRGEISVSVSKALKDLADSSLRVLDVETDLMLAAKLTSDDDVGA
jgi:hypothetical protein